MRLECVGIGIAFNGYVPVGIAPVAFSLNNAHNWRKFALPEAVGRKELDPVSIDQIAGAKNFSLDEGGIMGGRVLELSSNGAISRRRQA